MKCFTSHCLKFNMSTCLHKVDAGKIASRENVFIFSPIVYVSHNRTSWIGWNIFFITNFSQHFLSLLLSEHFQPSTESDRSASVQDREKKYHWRIYEKNFVNVEIAKKKNSLEEKSRRKKNNWNQKLKFIQNVIRKEKCWKVKKKKFTQKAYKLANWFSVS